LNIQVVFVVLKEFFQGFVVAGGGSKDLKPLSNSRYSSRVDAGELLLPEDIVCVLILPIYDIGIGEHVLLDPPLSVYLAQLSKVPLQMRDGAMFFKIRREINEVGIQWYPRRPGREDTNNIIQCNRVKWRPVLHQRITSKVGGIPQWRDISRRRDVVEDRYSSMTERISEARILRDSTRAWKNEREVRLYESMVEIAGVELFKCM
jgi:hypothetical protein